ncbi:SIS domain-containing protein, partial [Lysobacter sp. 2RAB21]
VKHGPMAIVGPGFPVLAFAQDDGTGDSTVAVAREFRARGAPVWLAAPGVSGGDALPLARSSHPAMTPLITVASFYKAVNALSVARGHNPDLPPHLNKVTETV